MLCICAFVILSFSNVFRKELCGNRLEGWLVVQLTCTVVSEQSQYNRGAVFKLQKFSHVFFLFVSLLLFFQFLESCFILLDIYDAFVGMSSIQVFDSVPLRRKIYKQSIWLKTTTLYLLTCHIYKTSFMQYKTFFYSVFRFNYHHFFLNRWAVNFETVK